MAKAKGVTGVEQQRVVTVSVDMEKAEILRLDATPGVKLVWDPFQWKELPQEVLKELSPESMEAYFKAKADVALRAKKAEGLVLGEMVSPLESRASYRLKIRARRGWHQCWKAPGQDFDVAMAGPYKQVRKQKEGENQAPGEENGEVLKILDGEGKVELIAVECPLDLYEQHLEAMSQKSTRMYTATKERFFESVEDINRGVSDKSARIKAVDESGEVQA